MKLGIIGGAGLLGATTAFYAGTKNILEEIKLVDLKENMAGSHAMDMEQAFLGISKTKVMKANYPDLYDCDIILITASLPERSVSSRNEYLAGNLSVIVPICQSLKQYCTKEAIVINATNPVDVFNYVVYKLLGWKREKFIGFTLNDTLRLRWAAALVTGKEAEKIEALCLGEHGEGQVRLYEQMTYEGRSMNLTERQKEQIEEKTGNWFAEYQALKSGRTTGWTSAVSLTAMIEAVTCDEGGILPGSAVLQGEFGYRDLSVGMPLRLGKEGILSIEEPGLEKGQKEKLDASAHKISELIRSIGF